MFILEKELGVFIDDNYPLLKFFSQMENLKRYKEEERNANKKGDTKTLR